MAAPKQPKGHLARPNPEWLAKQDEKAQKTKDIESDVQALKDQVKKLQEEVESLKGQVATLENVAGI